MWQQWNTYGFDMHEDEQAETKYSGNFLSFAKRSREVHRRSVVSVSPPVRDFHHSSPSLSQYGEEFWEKILRHPSRNSYDPYCGDQFYMFSRDPDEMVFTGVRGLRGENLSADTLPSPAQLMGRRKKAGGRVQRGDTAQRQADAVTQHIGELKRKQSVIDQMKKEKWWGTTLGYAPESSCSFDVWNQTSPETLWSLDPSHTHTAHLSPTHLTTGPTDPQSVQLFGGGDEMMDLMPGENPMMSFVVSRTAHREALKNWDTPSRYVTTPPPDTPYLDTLRPSHTEFWGFPSII